MTMTNDRQMVQAAEDMDTEVFVKHFNHRHGDSLGSGLNILEPALLDSYVEDCYRAFHRQLHRVRIDLDHEHVHVEG